MDSWPLPSPARFWELNQVLLKSPWLQPRAAAVQIFSGARENLQKPKAYRIYRTWAGNVWKCHQMPTVDKTKCSAGPGQEVLFHLCCTWKNTTSARPVWHMLAHCTEMYRTSCWTIGSVMLSVCGDVYSWHWALLLKFGRTDRRVSHHAVMPAPSIQP